MSATTAQPGPHSARSVIDSAFGLLALLRTTGPARVSELQRDSGLPRTTVQRLLVQLAAVGAVERSGAEWRLGSTLAVLWSGASAEPRLRSVARRPLLALASSTGALVALSVQMAGEGMVVDVFPGGGRLPLEPDAGMRFHDTRLAALQAHVQAQRGDLRPVIDAGRVHPDISCAAIPLRLPPRDAGAVWLMVPGGSGVPDPLVVATRETARRIAHALARSQSRAYADR